MKIARFFAVIFAVLGVVLMLGTAIVSFASMDASVKLVETPAAAVECSEKLVAAIDSGDFSAAGNLMYGQPDLGAQGVPADPITAMLWDAFLESVSCDFSGKLYLMDADFARDVSVTAMDITAVAQGVQNRVRSMLEAKVASATDMEELYDHENNFREDLIDQILRDAVEQALRQDVQYVTQDVTVKLICQDGQWWAVPAPELLSAISGGLA